MRLRTRAFVLLLVIAAPPARSAELPVDALIKMRTVAANQRPVFSPDGRWIALTIVDGARRAGAPDEAVPPAMVSADVWIVETATRKLIRGSAGLGSNWSPVWSEDGKRL